MARGNEYRQPTVDVGASDDVESPPAYSPAHAVGDASVPLLAESRVDETEEGASSAVASKPATVLHSIFNVVNLFMGVGLLSLPYSIKLGGWMSLPALILATLMFALSGHLIVEGFRKMEGSAQSYAALGKQACGEAGRVAVIICTILDMFGASAICLIMSCKQIEGLLHPMETIFGVPVSQAARAIGILAAAPLVCIQSFRQLAPVSLLGIVCSMLIVVMIMLVAAMDPERSYAAEPFPAQAPPLHHSISVSLPRSIGIFALSMTGHSALPSFRNGMRNPGLFHVVLNAAFGIMLVLNTASAAVGYWYWGDDVTEIVMQDIARKSPLGGFFGIGKIMTALIGLNALSKFPTLLLVLEDLVLSALASGKSQALPPKLGIMIKIAMYLGSSLLTAMAYNVLGLFMSLLGGLTSMNASVVFPVLFYLVLYWQEMSFKRRLAIVLLLAVAVSLSFLIVSENVIGLIANFQGHPTESMPTASMPAPASSNFTDQNPESLRAGSVQCDGAYSWNVLSALVPWAPLLN